MTNQIRTALITGASGGIGDALARVFARQGWGLILVARSGDKLAELARVLGQVYGVPVTTLVQDLAQPDGAEAVYEQVQQAGLTVDALVNNAGTLTYGPFVTTDWGREAETIALNLTALTRLCKLFLPLMVARGTGYVLNVGSTGSFVPGPLNAVYCATKAYVLSLSDALAEELDGTGVSVTCLCPGVTKTALQSHAGMDVRLMRLGAMEAEDVARQGYEALMAGKRVFVPGWSNRMQALSARLLPRRAVTRVGRALMQPVAPEKQP